MITRIRDAYRRVTDLSHLPEVAQIPAQILIKLYIVGGTLSFSLVLYALFFLLDEPQHTARMIARFVWLGVVFGCVLLTRRGWLRSGVLLASSFLLLIVLAEMTRVGGINALAGALVVPLLAMALINAKRELLLVSAGLTSIALGFHYWVLAQPAGTFPDNPYAGTSAVVTFAIVMCANTVIVYQASKGTTEHIDQIQESTLELERAREHERTRSIEAEQARHQANLTMMARSRFLANMSHELRTPLNAIIGYAEMIEEELAELDDIDPIYKEDTTRIQRAGRHLLWLIGDILDLSRIEAHKMPLVKDAGDLAGIAASASELVEHRAPSARIAWDVNVPDGFGVEIDSARFAQLVAQLALCMLHGGLVRVGADGARAEIVFEPSSDASGVGNDASTSSLIELREQLVFALVELLGVSLDQSDDRRWVLHAGFSGSAAQHRTPV